MRCKLGDISEITKLAGYEFTKYVRYIPDGEIIAVRALNLKNGTLVLDDIQRISKEVSETLPRSQLHKNDIVLSYTGTLGECAQIQEEGKYHLAPNVCKITPNGSVVNPNFLFQYIRCDSFKQTLINYAHGSTQPTIPMSTIRDIPVVIPDDFEKQGKIAAILSALDEKIAINREINDNLEQQAQSYFQELFVDNADPEWTTGTISDLGAVVGGSTPSKAKPEYYTESGIAWITPKDLSINKSKFVSHGENDITELGLKNSSAAIMPEGTVLFSSRAPIGYIAIAAGEVTTNQGFKSVVPKPEIGTPFVYFFLKNTLPVIEGMASGSTFKEVSGSTMKNVPAVIPDAETLAKFSDFCAPIFAQQRILEEQNQSLATLRDNLLPKLMSGEIDVSAVQL